MIQLSNPRTKAVIEDWPLGGSRRGTCTFEVESNRRGQRVNRVTTGKPKRTTYHSKCAIVDGDDGRTYVIATTAYGGVVRIKSCLKLTDYFSQERDPDEFNQITALLGQV